MVLKPISEQDFFRLTGLKDLHGSACLDRYQRCVHTTLAAVVQTRTHIPATAFKDKDAISNHADEINKILLEVYNEVRKRMKADDKLDLTLAWRSLAKGEGATPVGATPTTNATAAAPSASAATAATTTPTPTPAAAPSAFGFGKTTPTFGFGAAAPSAPSSAFGFGKAAPAATTGATAAPSAFGFGATTPAAAPTAFGFGKVTPAAATTAGAPAPAAGFAFGFNKPAAPAAQASPAPAPKKEVKFAPPQYFTGPFLEMPNFWEKEVVAKATLFNLDRGFVAANKDKLRERMLKWAQPCLGFYGNEIKYAPITDRDEETARVILRDADRTFFETEHREKFAEFLHSMLVELGTYGQSMSYLAGICCLALNERETAAILRKTAKEVLQGHWAAEAVGFASNAWVFEYILKKTDSELAKHFEKLNFWPDMYLQKIMSGLCVHVLPFNLLFDFLDRFMAEGMSFLFRFCLAITKVFRAELINTDLFDSLFSIMKLDTSMVTAEDVRKILAESAKIDIREYPLQELKSQMYDEKILPRLNNAPKAPEFEPCTLCEVNKPTKYNETHGIACDECAAKHADCEWEDW